MARCLALLLIVLPVSAFAQAMPADYQAVLTTLGKQGDFKENVLRVNVPRNDLHVVVDGVATPTPFGFGGWLALTKGTGGMDVMMGDLVLTEDEVNPVMSALLTSGLDVTALHNHFFFDTPRIYYMHVHGHGSAADLAAKVKPALGLIGVGSTAFRRGGPSGPPSAPPSGPPAAGREIIGTLDSAALARIVGYQGEQNGAVYKITIGRPDISLNDKGAAINSRMGLNTWAAFYGNNTDAVIAGDVAMLDYEVTPVLKALRANGIDVVAIHHHMTAIDPPVYFLHYWGKGSAQKLATAFRAALDRTGARPKATAAQR
jgi:uncharacterized protein DUF1259